MNIKILGLIGLLSFFGLIIIYSFQSFSTNPVAKNSVSRLLEISPGTSFSEITERLKKEGLIRSKTIFKIYSLLTAQAHQFKPGRYILETDISIPELARILTKGPLEISVAITPGMTVKEIDDKLSSLNIIRPNDLVNLDINFFKNDYPWLSEAKMLEGFLLPDTYRFFSDSDINLVIHKFLDNFEIKALPFFEGSDNILDKLILSSLLEKEIPDYEEKKIAAGILLKRLKTGMPLQIDASLVYAKCSGRFFGCLQLTETDYKIDSPYNTYLYPGLTESPITNPGLESIKSVLNPEKTDYWYYLSDPKTKKTIFSETLDEHNNNRAIYLLRK